MVISIRILHTSDVHLSREKSETLDALREVLRVASERNVEILTIGGDLFDTEEDADALRPKLRNDFSGNRFKIIVIPGNHDQWAYRRNLSFGSDMRILIKEPFDVYFRVWVKKAPMLCMGDEFTHHQSYERSIRT